MWQFSAWSLLANAPSPTGTWRVPSHGTRLRWPWQHRCSGAPHFPCISHHAADAHAVSDKPVRPLLRELSHLPCTDSFFFFSFPKTSLPPTHILPSPHPSVIHTSPRARSCPGRPALERCDRGGFAGFALPVRPCTGAGSCTGQGCSDSMRVFFPRQEGRAQAEPGGVNGVKEGLAA